MTATTPPVDNYLEALERNYQLMQKTEEKSLAQGSTAPEGTGTAWNLEQKLIKMLGIHSEARHQFDALQEQYADIRKYLKKFFS